MTEAGDEVHCRDSKDTTQTMLELFKNGYEVEVDGTIIRILGKHEPVLLTCAFCKHCENRNNEEPYCHQHAMVVTPDYFCADGEEGEWMP